MYTACSLLPVLSTFFCSSSPVLVSYDDMSLMYLELFFCSVCFSFIPLYIWPPSFNLDLTDISLKQLPAPLPPPSFFNLRVTYRR
uniref:Uncharacterized protein n=1 Tax=Rhizophagus irregularis (strain DAOM 181602 / DAOM 197198 / MUCL 43194) TaxID=747089 RepID=U9V545_RHIID